MPGSLSNPVVLDPFQTIIEVGWSGVDLMIVTARHIDVEDADFGQAFTKGSMRGAIVSINGHGDAGGEYLARENDPSDLDAFLNNATQAIGNTLVSTQPFGNTFIANTAAAALSLRSDPPFNRFGTFDSQCIVGSDFRLPDSTDEFFSTYYVWYCGSFISSPAYSTWLINVRKLREDWNEGDGLDIGQIANGLVSPQPEGGPNDRLESFRFRVTDASSHPESMAVNVRIYRGASGGFSHVGARGWVEYLTVPNADGSEVSETFENARLKVVTGNVVTVEASQSWNVTFSADDTVIGGATASISAESALTLGNANNLFP